MTKKAGRSYNMLVANCRRPTFGSFLQSDQTLHNSPVQKDDENSSRTSSSSNSTGDASPNYCLSPRSHPSPYVKSPWVIPSPIINNKLNNNGLIGTIVRQEGHVYSLATSSDLLYTGSDSKNIRVWKNLKEFTGFKSNSGLVKAIVIYGERIFTGHQDGKIRVWKVSAANPGFHKQIGSLPSLKDYVKSCLSPRKKTESIKHRDAVSCLGLNEEEGLLYSGSWDKKLKVWQISNYKCLESIDAHDDAINSVVVGFDSLVFTGSADGTVKAWRKETGGKRMKHSLVHTLYKQESAITALAVNKESRILYCGSSDGLVNFWELRGKQLCHGGVLRGHKMAVLCLASAGNLVVSGSADKSICVWKREIGGVHVCLSVLSGHNGPVKCLAIEQDRNNNNNKAKNQPQWILYSGSSDKSVKVWRMSEYVPMRFEEE